MNIKLIEDQLSRFNKLDEFQKETFERLYKKDKKSTFKAYLCWFFLGCHYLYLWKGNISGFIWIFYFITGGLCGVWMFFEMFRIPSKVKKINEDLVDDILIKMGV